MAQIEKYCFHHVPKTAGSSLQLRLSHREWLGELPKGSTLVVYPFHGDMRFYRVSEDPEFSPDEPIKSAFLRTYNRPRQPGNSSIVMGHLTNQAQVGKHITWLRDPLDRDISHFNYDMKSNSTLHNNFYKHLELMNGNFMMRWIYTKYMNKRDLSISESDMYQLVRNVLSTRFEKIYNNDDFENSWNEICEMLDLSPEPRLNANRGGEAYTMHFSRSQCTEAFERQHRQKNHYDYLLFEEFAQKS